MRLFVALCALIVAAATPAFAGPRVRVAEGQIEGVSADGLSIYKGVPFAAPPVGELRWRAPQPVARWQGVRSAAAFGPSCMQSLMPDGFGPWTPEFFPHNTVSEDCLYLNVWTPARARTRERLPIFVWIPGGGFRNGGGAVPLYDGAALAREGVVVVTLNYRVGAFGFLADDRLSAEPDGGIGNYGLRDVIAALHWLRENADAFGGDPNRITIAGQSAGGALVHLLMAAPQARGLFAQAIVQSSPLGAYPMQDRAAVQAPSARLAEMLSASDIAALRAASPEAVLAASDAIGFRPHIDRVLVPDDPARLLAQGRMADVPVLAGFTEHETLARLELSGLRNLSARYGADADAFSAIYPAVSDEEALEAGLAADRDRTRIGVERWAAARSRTGTAPTFLYLWTHAEPGPEASRYRAFHSTELVYMFGAFTHAPGREFTEADHAMSALALRYWANFVRSGDPNGEGVPAWPRVSRDATPILALNPTPAPLDPLPAPHRALLARELDTAGAFVFR